MLSLITSIAGLVHHFSCAGDDGNGFHLDSTDLPKDNSKNRTNQQRKSAAACY